MLVLGSEAAWSVLVTAGLVVAGAAAERVDPRRWPDAVAALKDGSADRLVLLDGPLAPLVDRALQDAPGLAARVLLRPGPGPEGVGAARGLPIDSTMDELVRVVMGKAESGAPAQVEFDFAGVSVARLLGAVAVLRPTLKITLTLPRGTAALCLCDGLVRAAGLSEVPLAASVGLAEDPSVALLMRLWATHDEPPPENRLHADLGFVCEYGDLFAESFAHREHVVRVLAALLAAEPQRATFEDHEPATRGLDLVLALREACLLVGSDALSAILPPGSRLCAPQGLPPRLREAFPPSRFGRLFFLLEEPILLESPLATARLPREEALAALAVAALTGALSVDVPPRPAAAPPVPEPESEPESQLKAPATRPTRRGRVPTAVAAAGQALAGGACGDARRFIEGLQEAAEHARLAGRRMRLRGTRFEPVGEVVDQLVLGYRIGSGAMGDVLLGVLGSQAEVLKVVAVKRRIEEAGPEPARQAMFLAEARLSASLAHPNIVQTHQLLRPESQYLLVMDFVHGLSAAELLARLGDERLSPALVAWIGAEVARGLHYAHGLEGPDGEVLGLVHRDVAPANLMLGLDGGVKLIDFGVAGARSEAHLVTDLRARTGRLSYMAPEVLRGKTVGPAVDQYALGVMLYELLTGLRPHLGTDDHTPIEVALSGEHRPLLEARPDVPPGLAYIVERAMSIHPEARFRDCDAMRQALLGLSFGDGDARDAVAELVRRLTRDVLPYEIEAIARLRRAAAALLSAQREAPPGPDAAP